MIDHVDFAVLDVQKSRAFYTCVLAPLGLLPLVDFDRPDGRQGTGFGRDGIGEFFIGGGSPVGGRLHVAFRAQSREAVDAFHRAALALGAEDVGARGPRPRYGDGYYAAFVRDPDGHVIEAVCREA